MGIILNGSSFVSTVRLNWNTIPATVKLNGTTIWANERYAFQDGATAISGGWGSANMLYSTVGPYVDTRLHFRGPGGNSNFGQLLYSGNRIPFYGQTKLSSLFSTNNNNWWVKDSNTASWNASVEFVILNELPSGGVIPFGGTLPTIAKSTIISTGSLSPNTQFNIGQYNGATLTTTVNVSGNYYLGLYFNGYDADADLMSFNNILIKGI